MQKKAVVLGGSSGIGLAIAQRFAAEGYAVYITGYKINTDVVKEILKSLAGSGHHYLNLDSRSSEDIMALEKAVKANFGNFDVLINSMGIAHNAHTIESDFDYWDDAIQVILYGTVKTSRALVPMLNAGGRIITISSIHNARVARGSSSYGMAKAAVMQFTRAMALELAPKGILVNSIAPGFVNTPSSIKADGQNELESEWFKENYIKNDHLPLKRAAQPVEIAGVAWFLAGPDASYITGAEILVDGGLLTTF